MRKFAFLSLGLVFLLSPLSVRPQEYLIDDGIGGVNNSVTTQVAALTGGNWDDGYFDLALPADNQFYFYGKKVTHLRIHTNGYVTMGYGSAPTDYTIVTNPNIPNPTGANGYVAPWWDDWVLTAPGGGGGELWYQVYSDAGQRVTIVRWQNVRPYGGSETYTFDVVFFAHNDHFYATRNGIVFSYIDVGTGADPDHDYGNSGTVGVEDPYGTQGTLYSYDADELVGSHAKDLYLHPFVASYDSTEFMNSVGLTDIMVYRPSQGVWKINEPGGSSQNIYFGSGYDVPLPGDFDADGLADPCIFRPSQGRWRVQGPDMNVYFGTHGDIPVPADYNGDGKTDIAIFRPGWGTWRIKYTGTGTTDTVYFGTQGDIPVPYDYDGDLKADIAIVRPGANLLWRIQYSLGGSASFYYGLEGDVPVPGDWDWDPLIGIWRPSDGTWRIKDYTSYTWGVAGDIPVPNDHNLGGMTDWAIWRPSTGAWRIKENGSTGQYTYYWGTLGDIPRWRRSVSVRAVAGGGK